MAQSSEGLAGTGDEQCEAGFRILNLRMSPPLWRSVDRSRLSVANPRTGWSFFELWTVRDVLPSSRFSSSSQPPRLLHVFAPALEKLDWFIPVL